MNWSIRWSKTAQSDLIDIWLYIAPENSGAADRQITRIENAVDRLADYPKSGPARNEIGSEVRALLVTRYLVLYRVREAEKRVELLRVIDGRRDLSSVFIESET